MFRGRIYHVGDVDVKLQGAADSGIIHTFLYPWGMGIQPVEGVDAIAVKDILALLRLSLQGMYAAGVEAW